MPGTPVRRLSAALLCLAAAGSALADARADLHAAFAKNMAARTYRSTITDLATGKLVATVEFQAPGRYRVQPAAGPVSVIADGKMHLNINGRVMSVPLPAGTLDAYRSDAAWKRMETNTSFSSAGLGAVGAEPARKYHWVTSGKNAGAGDTWVSVKSGYVLQVETAAKPGSKSGAVRVSYTDFNSPAIKVVAPK
jgi:hypothetical protein